MPSDYFLLFQDDDVLGCAELIRYLGQGAWLLLAKEMDGTLVAREHRGSKQLVDWVLERDAEDAAETRRLSPSDSDDDEDEDDDAEDDDAEDDDAEDDDGVTLGPRASRLREIAEEVGAQLCHSRLRGLAEGTWPPKPKPPRVQQVTGVAKRGVWLHVYHTVYTATTSQGDAYIYPPRQNVALLVFKRSSSMDMGRPVKLSKKILQQMEQFKGPFDQFEREQEKKEAAAIGSMGKVDLAKIAPNHPFAHTSIHIGLKRPPNGPDLSNRPSDEELAHQHHMMGVVDAMLLKMHPQLFTAKESSSAGSTDKSSTADSSAQVSKAPIKND